MGPNLHPRWRAVEQRGDFRDRTPFQVEQLDHGAIFRRQMVEQFRYDLFRGRRFHIVRLRVAVVGKHGLPDFGDGRQGKPFASLGSKLIDANVQGHFRGPVFQRRAAVEAIDSLDQSDKHFLRPIVETG